MTAPSLTPEEIARRRRGRNWALILVLAAFAGLFFAISIVKLAQHPDLFTTSLDGPRGQ
ncbi:MAG: hypothetical protein ACP5NP_14270 [Acetobacteraceae bacterium]|jgi:cytochrome c-type biogenesis protein CcmE